MDSKVEANKIQDIPDEQLVEIAGFPLVNNYTGPMAQAELLRRNTEALIASSKSANHYADKMMGLSLIVGLIAFLQLMSGILFASITPLEKVLCSIGIVALVAYAFRDYFIAKE